MVGWTPRTMRRKLAGTHKITQSDELAILQALQLNQTALPPD
jgi:hypothetical protein